MALVVAAAACVSAADEASKLRARVSPAPAVLATRAWSPTIGLSDRGKPVSARVALSIRQGAARRVFTARATRRRGSYRVRVAFPADGRWSWAVTAGRETIARGAVTVSTEISFDLPYDLAVAPDGTVLFLDRSRVLALDPATSRLRIHARATPPSEFVALERLDDGTLFVTDFPRNLILRIDPAGRVSQVARVAAPADLVADAAGTTLWVASIADGTGVFRVDVASGRVEPFADPENPHGIDLDANGDFVVQDGHAVSRIDRETGALKPFANVDAIKLLVAADGSVYGVEGNPQGGRVVRIAPDGGVTAIAGNNTLGPHRDGPALEAQILPGSVQFANDGALLVTQTEPVAAIRRVDLATGRITTLVRGR